MQVRKDLVIWPRSRMTCWDESLQPTRHQTAVMEWKFKGLDRSFGTRFPEAADEDREWLRTLSEIAYGSVGYSVIVDNRLGAERLLCSRAYDALIELEWLVV